MYLLCLFALQIIQHLLLLYLIYQKPEPCRHLMRSSCKQLMHLKKRLPYISIIRPAIGSGVHSPFLAREVFLQIFSVFTHTDRKVIPDSYFPGKHLHQCLSDRAIQHGMGIRKLLPPNSLGNISRHPSKFIAAASKFSGSRRRYPIILIC